MPSSNELGQFLRSRRAQVSPENAGVRTYGVRKVAGLRREEVAFLAGLSADYYTRLEQGRERNPSVQVIDALSRVLGLDADQEMHLYRLARLVPTARGGGGQGSVSPVLLQLMNTFASTPAFVLNRTLDILATNRLAAALFSPFTDADNLVHMVFTDPAGPEFFTDWDRAARSTVASLRLAVGHAPDAARVTRLVDEVSAANPTFHRYWEQGHVRGKTVETKKLTHPDVGPLDLTFQTFDVRDKPGQQLVIYQAEPGSAGDHALKLLGSPAATKYRDRENTDLALPDHG
ncbi:helix-turn-helix domain-containing protein [Nocardia paucivorans]|uniref:helix-turn-helix domain-containing protein n=1 Tax=Nocardia paucivorans TaxID=114259 RepID=UPI0002E17EDB|nr:helix-turn-helix transcriptional regulator [Nocardia paucivorans]